MQYSLGTKKIRAANVLMLVRERYILYFFQSLFHRPNLIVMNESGLAYLFVDLYQGYCKTVYRNKRREMVYNMSRA